MTRLEVGDPPRDDAASMAISGVIFDLDGTLADTIPVCCAAFRSAIRDHVDHEYTDAEIVALFGPSEEGIIRSITGDDWQACFDRFLTAYEDAHDRCPAPFAGIVTLLDTLRDAGIRLAIVTGKGRHSATISLRVLGLAPYFDPIETGSPKRGVKPDAIRRVLKHWNVPAGGVAYVGDAPSDMDDARASGVIPLAAAWSSTADTIALERAMPAALFRCVAALQEWLLQRTRH